MKKALNILLIALLAITVALCGWAIFSTPSSSLGTPDAASCLALTCNLLWGYLLVVGAICAAVFCAIWGLVKNPAGIKGSLLALGIVVVVVVASYLIAKTNQVLVPNIEDGGYFGEWQTILSSASIWVAYFGMAGAILAALWSEIAAAFK